MKLIVFLLLSTLLVSIDARSVDANQKRFIGSIVNWVSDTANTIGNGVNNAINTVVDTANTVGNAVAGVGISVGDFFGNTLPSSITTAAQFVNQGANVALNMAAAIFGGAPNMPIPPDPCTTTCFQRVSFNGNLVDYFFDKPNGCISKGVSDPAVNVFNNCCDLHNQCLNSQCCTTDCQSMKNDCDSKYASCMKKSCMAFLDDDTEFYTCLARSKFMLEAAAGRTCNVAQTVNRKICYC